MGVVGEFEEPGCGPQDEDALQLRAAAQVYPRAHHPSDNHLQTLQSQDLQRPPGQEPRKSAWTTSCWALQLELETSGRNTAGLLGGGREEEQVAEIGKSPTKMLRQRVLVRDVSDGTHHFPSRMSRDRDVTFWVKSMREERVMQNLKEIIFFFK